MYIIIIFLSIILGQLVAFFNKKLPPVVAEEITYKEFFKDLKQNYKKDFKIDFKYSIILIVLNCLLVFLNKPIYLIYIYSILIATLLIAFSVDFRFSLIPDECHIIIVLLSIVNMIFNLNNWYLYLLGGLAGGAVFYGISMLGYLIYKKEGMGFGDVKLMAALGLLFGLKNILIISLLSLFIGAIVGGIFLIIKRKEKESYIPFGPFIVISTIVGVYLNLDYVLKLYFNFCMFLSNSFSNLIQYISNL